MINNTAANAHQSQIAAEVLADLIDLRRACQQTSATATQADTDRDNIKEARIATYAAYKGTRSKEATEARQQARIAERDAETAALAAHNAYMAAYKTWEDVSRQRRRTIVMLAWAATAATVSQKHQYEMSAEAAAQTDADYAALDHYYATHRPATVNQWEAEVQAAQEVVHIAENHGSAAMRDSAFSRLERAQAGLQQARERMLQPGTPEHTARRQELRDAYWSADQAWEQADHAAEPAAKAQARAALHSYSRFIEQSGLAHPTGTGYEPTQASDAARNYYYAAAALDMADTEINQVRMQFAAIEADAEAAAWEQSQAADVEQPATIEDARRQAEQAAAGADPLEKWAAGQRGAAQWLIGILDELRTEREQAQPEQAADVEQATEQPAPVADVEQPITLAYAMQIRRAMETAAERQEDAYAAWSTAKHDAASISKKYRHDEGQYAAQQRKEARERVKSTKAEYTAAQERYTALEADWSRIVDHGDSVMICLAYAAGFKSEQMRRHYENTAKQYAQQDYTRTEQAAAMIAEYNESQRQIAEAAQQARIMAAAEEAYTAAIERGELAETARERAYYQASQVLGASVAAALEAADAVYNRDQEAALARVYLDHATAPVDQAAPDVERGQALRTAIEAADFAWSSAIRANYRAGNAVAIRNDRASRDAYLAANEAANDYERAYYAAVANYQAWIEQTTHAATPSRDAYRAVAQTPVGAAYFATLKQQATYTTPINKARTIAAAIDVDAAAAAWDAAQAAQMQPGTPEHAARSKELLAAYHAACGTVNSARDEANRRRYTNEARPTDAHRAAWEEAEATHQRAHNDWQAAIDAYNHHTEPRPMRPAIRIRRRPSERAAAVEQPATQEEAAAMPYAPPAHLETAAAAYMAAIEGGRSLEDAWRAAYDSVYLRNGTSDTEARAAADYAIEFARLHPCQCAPHIHNPHERTPTDPPPPCAPCVQRHQDRIIGEQDQALARLELAEQLLNEASADYCATGYAAELDPNDAAAQAAAAEAHRLVEAAQRAVDVARRQAAAVGAIEHPQAISGDLPFDAPASAPAPVAA